MRVSYVTRRSDLVVFNIMHQFLSPRLQLVFLLFAALIGYSVKASGLVAVVMLAAVAYSILWLLQAMFLAFYVGGQSDPTVLTEHTLELREHGLLEETAFNRSEFYWHGIRLAVKRPGFFAIYVSAGLAHVVPNRAFLSPCDRAAFQNMVESYIRSAAS